MAGTINSCGAVAGAVQGKEYDEKTGRWIFYNLPEEAELVSRCHEPNILSSEPFVMPLITLIIL